MPTDTATPDAPGQTDRDPALWVIRLAALVGLCIAGYLFALAARGGAPLGCGEASGCADVLASRWSKVWRFPVSLPAMVAYLVVLAASLHAGPRSPKHHRDKASFIISAVAVAAGGAALWFVGLQLFELKHVCVFCMAAHACSLVVLAAAFYRGPRVLPLVGLAGVAALVALQILLPPPAGPIADGLVVGNFEPHQSPTLGDPDAPHVVGLLYDYNCGYCRVTHQHLQQALERYPGQLVVVLLPTAIDPDCNKHVQQAADISLNSCAIARLALAVWVADPNQFAAFDAYLVEQVPRRRGDAGGGTPVFREEAERLVGADALAEAMDDPRIDERLERSADLYAQAVNPVTQRPGVPRVIIGGRVFGSFESAGQLFDALEEAHPDLQPTGENR